MRENSVVSRRESFLGHLYELWMWQIESQIRYIQAQIAGNSGTIAKICNADVADLGFNMRFHEFIEVPFNRNRLLESANGR